MSKTHFDNLLYIIPDLRSRSILDVGSGRGKFLIDAASRGCDVYGVEVFQDYIDISLEHAKERNIQIKVEQGLAENLPFEDDKFDFINLSEVIEHVDNPEDTLSEISRVLKKGGKVYLSVPSRFSYFDTHYHLLFLNWIPRSWAHKVIGYLGKHKDYTQNNGKQRIDEMFYTTYNSFKEKVKNYDLVAYDIREIKIKKKFKNEYIQKIALSLYRIIRHFYFKSFHFLIEKK